MMQLLYTWRTQANEMRPKKELISVRYLYKDVVLRYQSQKCWCYWFQLSFGQWVSVLYN